MKICAKLNVLHIVPYNKEKINVSHSIQLMDAVSATVVSVYRLFFLYLLFFFFCQGTYWGKEGKDHLPGQQSRRYFLLRLKSLTANLDVIWGV